MASEVDICNLALAHLGDAATLASIDPPEGSAQADHCARWYPIARDSLLEQHDWNFCTRRSPLVLMSAVPTNGWLYTYRRPLNALRVFAVLPATANDDYTAAYSSTFDYGSQSSYTDLDTYTQHTPRPFALETLDDGTEVIVTNEPDAVGRYTVRVIDPTKFSPLFVDTLSWYLAGYLAGPVIKGDAGRAEAKNCLQVAMSLMNTAARSDANQQFQKVKHSVPWMANR